MHACVCSSFSPPHHHRHLPLLLLLLLLLSLPLFLPLHRHFLFSSTYFFFFSFSSAYVPELNKSCVKTKTFSREANTFLNLVTGFLFLPRSHSLSNPLLLPNQKKKKKKKILTCPVRAKALWHQNKNLVSRDVREELLPGLAVFSLVLSSLGGSTQAAETKQPDASSRKNPAAT